MCALCGGLSGPGWRLGGGECHGVAEEGEGGNTRRKLSTREEIDIRSVSW